MLELTIFMDERCHKSKYGFGEQISFCIGDYGEQHRKGGNICLETSGSKNVGGYKNQITVRRKLI